MVTDLPKLSLSRVVPATSYILRVEAKDIGWAICTINDDTNELNVQSDWGDWHYRWGGYFGWIGEIPRPSIDQDDGDEHRSPLQKKTLTHFLATKGETWTDRDGIVHHESYVADKLTSSLQKGERNARSTFSAERTVDEIQRRILERRREMRIDRDAARDMFDRVEDLRHHQDLRDFVDEVCSRYETDIPDWAFDRCEDIHFEETHAYRILRDSIIPALALAIRMQHPRGATDA